LTKKNPLETAVAMARERNMEHSFEDSMLEFTSYSDNFPGILLESIITWQEKPSVILVTSFFHYPVNTLGAAATLPVINELHTENFGATIYIDTKERYVVSKVALQQQTWTKKEAHSYFHKTVNLLIDLLSTIYPNGAPNKDNWEYDQHRLTVSSPVLGSA